ncbi:MAG: peptidylprolyl isomerase [Bryobacterales bacterium]
MTLNTMRAPCDEGIRRSFSNLTRDRNAFVRAAVTQGLGRCELDDQALEALRRAAADPDPKVRIEAAWAAARSGDERVREIITALAGDPHPAVTEQAAGLMELAAAAHPPTGKIARRAGRVLDLRSPLPTLPLPVTKQPREAAEPFTPQELQQIARRTRRSLVVETPEGSFPLTLDYENAPLAAERFYDMAIAAQFDGQPFSVLPDDYAQVPAKPSSPLLTPEPSPAPFLRGSLGMVRAGRTTDAPEFFIALTPLPGAEGRYTNFGRLLAGDDVLDRLRSGTRILRIRPNEE